MIPVRPARPPKTYVERVLQPGRRWLKNHPDAVERPPAYWLRVRAELARAFGQRCGYSAMYEPVGTVDHYLSIAGGNRKLAYSWSNLRYAAQWINSAKGTLDRAVMDPFEVKDGWFELLLGKGVARSAGGVGASARDRDSQAAGLLRSHREDERRGVEEDEEGCGCEEKRSGEGSSQRRVREKEAAPLKGQPFWGIGAGSGASSAGFSAGFEELRRQWINGASNLSAMRWLSGSSRRIREPTTITYARIS